MRGIPGAGRSAPVRTWTIRARRSGKADSRVLAHGRVARLKKPFYFFKSNMAPIFDEPPPTVVP